MKTNQSQGWHRADIKAALEKKGYNLAAISRHLGHRDDNTAYRVLRHAYPVVERLVADIIGVEPQIIWPDRYNADGTTKGGGIRRKYTPFLLLGNSKNKGAA